MTNFEEYTLSNCEVNLAGIKWTHKKSKKQYNFFIKGEGEDDIPELWIKDINGNKLMTTYTIEAINSSCFITFESVKYKVLLISNKTELSVMELETPSGQVECFEGTI